MIIMLFDNPSDCNNTNFIKKYSSHKIKLVYPDKRCKSINQMYKFCSQIMKTVQKDDIIICWYDFMGVICWWISKFRRIKCNIIAINILLKYKHSVKNKLARFLYKHALTASNFKSSITSREYGEWLNSLLGISQKYILIHDAFHEYYEINISQSNSNSVFCGGRNGRDWEFLFNLAKKMEDVNFNVIMDSKEYGVFENITPKNVKVRTDTSENEFIQMMVESSIVALPLDTQAPAGLIAIFEAGANSKCVITTDTATTREYIGNDRGILLPNNIDKWKETIYEMLSNKNKREMNGKKLKTFLVKECTEKQFVNGIDILIESF